MPRKHTEVCWACGCNAEFGTDHLALLKKMRLRISKSVFDDDTPPRDLAALTRRLQDIAREIDTLEERARAEGRDRPSNDNTNNATGDDKPGGWDDSQV